MSLMKEFYESTTDVFRHHESIEKIKLDNIPEYKQLYCSKITKAEGKIETLKLSSKNSPHKS